MLKLKKINGKKGQGGGLITPLISGIIGLVILVIIGFVVIVGVLSLCILGGNEDNNGNKIETFEDSTNELSVHNAKITTESNAVKRITGSIENNSSETYSYVQIEFDVIDSNSGELIGDTFAEVSSLAPDEEQDFQVPVIAEESCEITITGTSVSSSSQNEP